EARAVHLGELRGSDHLYELVERCDQGESGTCIDPELTVASPQDLDEGMTSDHDSAWLLSSSREHCLGLTVQPQDPLYDLQGHRCVERHPARSQQGSCLGR